MNHHAQILRIARAGNPARAMQLFAEQGLDAVVDDPKILTLKGRLIKDQARQSQGEQRQRLYTEASAAYRAAFECEPNSYPLINAAALALLGGATARSNDLARRVLAMIESDPTEGETAYWREATRAEALLLLGKRVEAEAALSAAIDKLPLAHPDQAATIGQFELIVAAQAGDPGWLEAYRPPPSLHFSGLIGLDPTAPGLQDAVAQSVDRIAPGYAYGALAAGADIMIAEAAVAQGASLHLTLPNSVDEFRARSVAPFGSEWLPRFDALIEQSDQIDIVALGSLEEDCPFALAIELASLMSMGSCIRHASNLRSQAHAITVAAPGEEERPHLVPWARANRSLIRIETARANDGASPAVAVVSEDSKLRFCGLVALSEPAAELARHHAVEETAGGDGRVFVGDPQACLGLASEVSRSDPKAALAVVLDALDPAQPDTGKVSRVRHLCRAAETGQILTDRQSALIAQVIEPRLWIEEMGELASLDGPISLWSFAL